MADNMQTEMQTEPEESSGPPALSALSILRTLRKRRFLIASTWILFTAVGVAVVRVLPAVYLSETVVLIDTQKIPEKFVSPTVASDLEDRIASIRETLLSNGELKKIVDDFGLYREERKTLAEEEILDKMRKDISITLEPVGSGGDYKRTAAFRIGFQGRDPELVMRVANRLTDLYVDQNLKTREGEAKGTSDFLDTQLLEAKKRLDELEAAVSSYKLHHNGELPQQVESLNGVLTGLRTQLQANIDALNRVQQTKITLESNLNTMEASAALQAMRSSELAGSAKGVSGAAASGVQVVTKPHQKASEALQDELTALLAKVTDNHPDAIRLRSAIEAAKREEELEQAREAGIRAQIEVTEAELANRNAEQKRILSELDQYQRRIEQIPVREQEMAQITRDYELSKENYKSLEDKKTAAEMALDMERRQQSERFTILDRAQVPEKPIKPNRPALYAAAAGSALVLGLVIGFGFELRRNVVLGEWELPAGTPVLARLPRIEVPAASDQTKTPSPGWWFSRKKGITNASFLPLLLGAGTWLKVFFHRL